jgi:tetratricopeptide (TPR) repeat protein
MTGFFIGKRTTKRPFGNLTLQQGPLPLVVTALFRRRTHAFCGTPVGEPSIRWSTKSSAVAAKEPGLRDHSFDEGKTKPATSSNSMAGVVVGTSVQAGSITGGVHFHHGSHPSGIPRQLVAASPHFVGRIEELAKLRSLITAPGPALAVLSGPGGVGKTGLARRWAEDNKEVFPDGQLHIDLGGFSGGSPLDPGEALGAFLRALGVPSKELPHSLHELAALYRSRTAGRVLLVVLENAHSAAQVRVLLPASGSSRTLITSRSRLTGLIPEGGVLIEVQPLSAAESLGLLTHIVGPRRVGQERQQAEHLAAACGGLPLALCLVGARLATRPQLTLARVGRDLSDETNRLSALDRSPDTSIRAAFDWSYRSLGPAPAAMYRRLALHPGQDFGLGPIMALAPGMPGAGPGADGVGPAEVLLEGNLLQEVTEERFRFHDLLRLHALQKADAEDTDADRAQALLAMVEWYLAAAAVADHIVTPYRRRLPYAYRTDPGELPLLTERDEALTWLASERLNLIAAAGAALDRGWAELSWQLADAMWALLLYRKHYRDRQIIDARGVAAARLWGNAWAEGRMLKRLGRTCTVAGDYRAAEEHLRTAMLRSSEAGDAHGTEEAHEMLASLYRDSGREALALETFHRVLQAKRGLGESRNIGLTLINIGMLESRMGRPRGAIEALRQAEALLTPLADVDPYNVFRVQTGLAGAYLQLGELGAAQEAAAGAAAGMRALGSAFEHAEALDLLGRIAGRRGDVLGARRHLGAALDIFDSLGSSRATGLRARIARLAGREAPPEVNGSSEGVD